MEREELMQKLKEIQHKNTSEFDKYDNDEIPEVEKKQPKIYEEFRGSWKDIPDYLKSPELFSGRIWGKLSRSQDKKTWVIEGHPYMIATAKRIFPGSRGWRGEVSFPVSKRYIGELNWFMIRFPLIIEDNVGWHDELKKAQKHFEIQAKLLKEKPKERPTPEFIGKLKEFQKEGLAFLLHNPRSLLADEMGLGKSQPIDSFLLTPDGWVMMKYIKIGDKVFGQDGKPKKIIGVFPQGKRPVYRITFSDNSYIECDKNHIWAVKTTNHRFRNSHFRHLTLEQIMEKGLTYDNGNSLHFIPMVSPIEFEKRELSLDPYVLGCFIGDGCLIDYISFSTIDAEIIDIIKTRLKSMDIVVKKKKGNNCDYTFVIKGKRVNNATNPLKDFFIEFGLFGKKSHEKFIPEEYLFSNIYDRISLLQGLLDTDGSITKSDNHIEFSSTSERLANDVKFIVESLGGIVKINCRMPKYIYKKQRKIGKKSYRLTIALPKEIEPFKLKRKANVYHPREKYLPYRAIKKIEYIDEKECQCIKVDSDNGLYVTENCIMTHNTPTALAWLTSLKCGPPYLIVVPPHIVCQWESEIRKFLTTSISTHIITGLKPYPLPEKDIYLIHYLILRGWREELPKYGFSACVFDEIQELRRHQSEKYAVSSLLTESCDNVIGLSGTPIYNYGNEMWNIMNILNYHCLGDSESFSREWCEGYGSRINESELFGEFLRTEGLMLRRRKEDVMDELPPKRRMIQNIDVDQGIFDQLIAPAIEQAKKIPSIKNKWEKGRMSMEAIDQARMATGIAKAHYVSIFVKMLLEAGEVVLLYGHHHKVIDIFVEQLHEHYPVIISGRQDTKKKNEAQKAFMNGDTDLIVVSLRSGTGLNLQRGRCVVFGELDWSPAVHTQCEDRAHRMGVKDSVLCYYLTCGAGTDADMMETLGVKTSQFLTIMGDRKETAEDKILAQATMKDHMSSIIKTLQEGGRKKPSPTTEIAEKIRNLERMPKTREPTSLDGFYKGVE